MKPQESDTRGKRLRTSQINMQWNGAGPSAGPQPLAGVVAFVDVRTIAGKNAAQETVQRLESLGARVVGEMCTDVTHVVVAFPRPSTRHLVRAFLHECPQCRPFVVGPAWAEACAKTGSRQCESAFYADWGETLALPVLNTRPQLDAFATVRMHRPLNSSPLALSCASALEYSDEEVPCVVEEYPRSMPPGLTDSIFADSYFLNFEDQAAFLSEQVSFLDQGSLLANELVDYVS